MATYKVFAHDVNGLPISEVTIEAIDLDNWPTVAASAVTDHRGYAAFTTLDGSKTYYFRPVSPRGDSGARAVGVQVYLEGATMNIRKFETKGKISVLAGEWLYAHVVHSDGAVAYYSLGNQNDPDIIRRPNMTGRPLAASGGVSFVENAGPLGHDSRIARNTTTGILSHVVETGDDLNLSDPLTLEIWARRTRTGVIETFLSKANGGYELFFGADNKVYLAKTLTTDLRRSTATITDTAWHHIAATRDGTNIRIYIDGADVTDPAYAPFSGAFNTNAAAGLRLFQRTDGARAFVGDLASFSVYSKALPADRILEHYRIAQTHKSVAVTGATSATISNLYVPNRAGCAVLVMFWYRSATDITPTVTVGTTTASLLTTVAQTAATPNLRGAVFLAKDVASGFQNVSVTWSGSVDALVTAVVATDVDSSLAALTGTATANTTNITFPANTPANRQRAGGSLYLFFAEATGATFSYGANNNVPYQLGTADHTAWKTVYAYRPANEGSSLDQTVYNLSATSPAAAIGVWLEPLVVDTYTFEVPVGVNAIIASLWGGGGNAPVDYLVTSVSAFPGGGGGSEGLWDFPLSVSPGDQLTVLVGRGGGWSRMPGPFWRSTANGGRGVRMSGGASALVSGSTIVSVNGGQRGGYNTGGQSGGGIGAGSDARISPIYASGAGGGNGYLSQGPTNATDGGACGFLGGKANSTAGGGGGGGPMGPGGHGAGYSIADTVGGEGVGGAGGGGGRELLHLYGGPGGDGSVVLQWTA